MRGADARAAADRRRRRLLPIARMRALYHPTVSCGERQLLKATLRPRPGASLHNARCCPASLAPLPTRSYANSYKEDEKMEMRY